MTFFRESLRKQPGLWVILAANLLPAFGVLFWGWRVFDVVFLYWLENVVIGLLNVVKILTCQPEPNLIPPPPTRPGRETPPPVPHELQLAELVPQPVRKLSTAVFFCLHYGLFTQVHGLFVILLFSNPGGISHPGHLSDALSGMGNLFWLGLAAIGIGQLYSLITDFYRNGEYKRQYPLMLMRAPYGRVVILHIAILGGAFAIQSLGSPWFALLILIFGKTWLELKLARKSRKPTT